MQSNSFKKIVYVTSVRLPTEKAHGLATVKICEAFADLGYEVELIVPKLWRKNGGNVYDYYGVKPNFKIIKIPCIDLIPLKIFDTFTFLLQSLSFSVGVMFFSLFKYGVRVRNSIFFSHDYMPLYFMTLLPYKIFYDIHHFPGRNFMYRRIMKRSFGFAVQTKWKVGELERQWGISPQSIIYWPNGSSVERFDIKLSKKEARDMLGIPQDKKIIMYTGSLFDWKGIDAFIQSIAFLPEDYVFYLVGGSEGDIKICKENIKEARNERVNFVSFQQYTRIPIWLRAADVLVLPNTGKQKVSLYYTSPMKLFDYLASGKPIVASSIPSILEILNSSNAFLVTPDSPETLAMEIKKAAENTDIAKRISENALLDSKKYTWPERAKKIIGFFETHV